MDALHETRLGLDFKNISKYRIDMSFRIYLVFSLAELNDCKRLINF